jgi:pyridoxal phosphate enzyme (YggS family)
MGRIAENLQAVTARLANASRHFAQPVILVAVSKAQPVDAIRQAWVAGQRRFGENYVQEALDKMAKLTDLPIEWHFIGPLQSNKSRPVAESFAWVHSVARDKIARRLSEQRPDTLPPLNVCLQVNISDEDTKSGVAPDEIPSLAESVAKLPRLRLRGLMTIAEPGLSQTQTRAQFCAMRLLFDELNALGHDLDTLSMGMTDDLELAIAEGATLVRVGTAIFGARPAMSVGHP